MQSQALWITIAALFLTGCSEIATIAPSSASGASDKLLMESAGDDLVEFNGIAKMKSELSEDTLKWLEWYQTLPETHFPLFPVNL